MFRSGSSLLIFLLCLIRFFFWCLPRLLFFCLLFPFSSLGFDCLSTLRFIFFFRILRQRKCLRYLSRLRNTLLHRVIVSLSSIECLSLQTVKTLHFFIQTEQILFSGITVLIPRRNILKITSFDKPFPAKLRKSPERSLFFRGIFLPEWKHCPQKKEYKKKAQQYRYCEALQWILLRKIPLLFLFFRALIPLLFRTFFHFIICAVFHIIHSVFRAVFHIIHSVFHAVFHIIHSFFRAAFHAISSSY